MIRMPQQKLKYTKLEVSFMKKAFSTPDMKISIFSKEILTSASGDADQKTAENKFYEAVNDRDITTIIKLTW